MNGAILILVGMYMGIDYMNEVSFKKCLKMCQQTLELIV